MRFAVARGMSITASCQCLQLRQPYIMCRDEEEVAAELGLTKKGRKKARDRAKRRCGPPDGIAHGCNDFAGCKFTRYICT